MNIEIFSAENAAKEVKQHANKWHVISLRDDKYGTDHHPMNGLDDRTKDIIIKKVDDVSDRKYESWGYKVPEEEDVQDILDWVKKREIKNLMVHCWAGVSRSSATAYIVACTVMPPEEAIKLLNPDIHIPNELIMLHGANILDDREVWLNYSRKFLV